MAKRVNKRLKKSKAEGSSKATSKNKTSRLKPFLRESTPEDRLAMREFLAFVLFTFAAFSLLSLISFDPSDPSLNTLVQGQYTIKNYGGMWGSYLSDIYIQCMGYSAYAFVALLFGLCLMLVFTDRKILSFRPIVSVFLCFTALSSTLSLLDKSVTYPSSWGGALGYFSVDFGTRYLGYAGLILCIAICFFATLLFLSGQSVRAFFQSLNDNIAGAAQWTVLQLKKLFKAIANLFSGKTIVSNSSVPNSPKSVLEKQSLKAPSLQVFAPKAKSKETSLQNTSSSNTSLDIPIVIKQQLNDNNAANEQSENNKKNKAVLFKTENTIEYELPNINLLEAPDNQELDIDRDALLTNAKTLEEKLKDFGVKGRVVEVQPGPVVTLYEFEPAPGVKVNQITRLNDDLTLALRALSVRINMMPGKSVVGVEVANMKRQTVYLKDVVDDKVFKNNESLLTVSLGKDISGNPYAADLRKMPHLLVAGATGSGKSVAINSIITSILYKATPDQVRMILVDPKMLELSLYDKIPHLLLPVVTDPKKASAALKWAVKEMERRYRLMADIGVRNLEGYNGKVWDVIKEQERIAKEKQAYQEAQESNPNVYDTKKEEHTGTLPFIVIVIDELADLMMVSSKEVEESIIRLAQMARASGIHLLLATQRPSVDVITGVIKANMPSRISFQVSSKIDSRTIIDSNGAEMLLGAGDMLYLPPGTSKLKRVHGAFVSDSEVERVTNFWKKQAQPQYKEEILQATEESAAHNYDPDDPDNEIYGKALELVKQHGSGSISMVQRRLRIGYNRAARLIERMEDEGYLITVEAGKPKQLNMSQF